MQSYFFRLLEKEINRNMNINMIMAILRILKSKIILVISALAILNDALAFTSILTNNKNDNYTK